ncbi:MAG: glycosyltransferase family 4 protein [Calditrichia bacterium]
MKIIHVTWTAENYGIGTFLYNLLENQVNTYKNTKVAIAFHNKGPKLDQYYNLNLKVYNLEVDTAKDAKLFSVFREIFKNYDIVNLHGMYVWAFLAALKENKKVVYTFHGALGLRRVMGIPITFIFMKYIFSKKCHYFTFASQAALKHFQDNLKINLRYSSNYKIFPYGLSINKIQATKNKEVIVKQLGIEGKFIIGTAIRLVQYKRPELLINAFSKMLSKKNSCLILMGKGIQSYEEDLKSLVKELDLCNEVLFLGFRSDVIDIINVLDVFVLPSRREPFGLALLEAMALGIPSIVFKDSGGAKDIIGDAGFVVENVDELAATLEHLNNNANLRKKLQHNVRFRSRQFDISGTSENLLKIYNSLYLLGR